MITIFTRHVIVFFSLDFLDLLTRLVLSRIKLLACKLLNISVSLWPSNTTNGRRHTRLTRGISRQRLYWFIRVQYSVQNNGVLRPLVACHSNEERLFWWDEAIFSIAPICCNYKMGLKQSDCGGVRYFLLYITDWLLLDWFAKV